MAITVQERQRRHASLHALTLIIGSCLLLIGSILLTAGVWRLLPARASRSWRAANGVIIEARLPSNCARCWPVINYRYVVTGQSFVGDHLVAGPQDYYWRHDAEIKVAEYVVGRQVTAYYDPSSPAFSCLEPGIIRWPAYLFFTTGPCCLGAALFLWWRVYRRRPYAFAKTDAPAPEIESYNSVAKDTWSSWPKK
jgi:Protein of unknown function (DUF3592)